MLYVLSVLLNYVHYLNQKCCSILDFEIILGGGGAIFTVIL